MVEEPNMRSTLGSANQTRPFTFSYFFKQYKEGWLIIFDECLRFWSQWRSQRRALEAPLATCYETPVGRTERVNRATRDREGQKDNFENSDLGQSSGTLIYGFDCISKLFHLMLLYGPGFVFDSRPGLLPSTRFILTYHAVIISGMTGAFFIAKFILEPTLLDMMPGLSKSITQLLALVSTICQLLITVYGLGSLSMIAHNSRFVRDFVLYHCNIVSLPKSFQRRKAVELFFSHYVLCIISKPIPLTLRLIHDSLHPRELIHWGAGAFAIARASSIAVTAVGSALVCTSGMLVPYINSFLIVCLAEHLNNFLQRHLSRFERTINKQPELSPRDKRQNPRLVELLDEQTRQIIKDYSCNTLLEDWPDLIIEDDFEKDQDENSSLYVEVNESHNSDMLPQSSEPPESKIFETGASNIRLNFVGRFAYSVCGHKKESTGPPISQMNAKKPSVGLVDRKISADKSREEGAILSRNLSLGDNLCYNKACYYNSAASGLLFLYKNLIKSMSELKCMIATYEKKFGAFHLIQICIDSLIVAQWINTILTESRLRQESKLASNENRQQNNTSDLNINLANDSIITPLGVESTIGVVSFIISNTYIFMRCNCLPESILKMRSKLFRMNIDLARLALRSHHQGHNGTSQSSLSPPPSDSRTRRVLAAPVCNESGGWPTRQQLSAREPMRANSLGLVGAEDFSELDQMWSLYDQVDRLSELANLKLAAGTYYSKRCLLLIFGRTVSLTLFYIQIVDIYSYT